MPGFPYSIDNRWKTISGLPKLTDGSVRLTVAGFKLIYDTDDGSFVFDKDFYGKQTTNEAKIINSIGDRSIARAEYTSILGKLQQGLIGDVPCNVEWSNSRRIDTTRRDTCVHFSAASNGDIFVIFAAIPKKYETWYYIQLSPDGKCTCVNLLVRLFAFCLLKVCF